MIAAGCLCLRGDGAMRLTRVGLVDTRAAELRISMVGACCFRGLELLSNSVTMEMTKKRGRQLPRPTCEFHSHGMW